MHACDIEFRFIFIFWGRTAMVTFVILLNVEGSKVNSIAEQMAGMPQISEVFSVTGNYDLIAIVRTRTNDDVADLVNTELSKLDGIIKTDTLLAFKAYSRHDLEAMFTI
ncbi:MAG: DNA-binding Lrp family transcriptional regulator [Gammaproteobacteria bacterium]|jgi:DNA-binding Lrp family transcriptional regulator